MIITFELNGRQTEVWLDRAVDISLPLAFDGANPNCYYAEAPTSEVIRAEGFVGSVAEGGTVNYRRYQLTPHGNGTHTECVGHISADADAHVCRNLNLLVPALVITVPITRLGEDDVVPVPPDLHALLTYDIKALVIRTLPNGPEKKLAQYSGANPPYLAAEWGPLLKNAYIEHLLVDLPSLDREQDGGALQVHKAFFLPDGKPKAFRTVTELIYVPDHVLDGYHLLNLMMPHWQADAAPSRPLLYAVKGGTLYR